MTGEQVGNVVNVVLGAAFVVAIVVFVTAFFRQRGHGSSLTLTERFRDLSRDERRRVQRNVMRGEPGADAGGREIETAYARWVLRRMGWPNLLLFAVLALFQVNDAVLLRGTAGSVVWHSLAAAFFAALYVGTSIYRFRCRRYLRIVERQRAEDVTS